MKALPLGAGKVDDISVEIEPEAEISVVAFGGTLFDVHFGKTRASRKCCSFCIDALRDYTAATILKDLIFDRSGIRHGVRVATEARRQASASCRLHLQRAARVTLTEAELRSLVSTALHACKSAVGFEGSIARIL